MSIDSIGVLLVDDHEVVRRGIGALLATEDSISVVGEAADGEEIKAGASGYLLKDTGPEDLVEAIQQVDRGESSLNPTIARKLLREVSQPPAGKQTADPLTERELEVLGLIAKGRSNQDIADELVISEATVRTHVSNILGKLHLASRTQAALYALREGLASLDVED
jgi:NarL family two-component system response regulator LiaR